MEIEKVEQAFKDGAESGYNKANEWVLSVKGSKEILLMGNDK